MDQRGPLEFILEAFADPSSVRDVVRGNALSPPPPASSPATSF